MLLSVTSSLYNIYSVPHGSGISRCYNGLCRKTGAAGIWLKFKSWDPYRCIVLECTWRICGTWFSDKDKTEFLTWCHSFSLILLPLSKILRVCYFALVLLFLIKSQSLSVKFDHSSVRTVSSHASSSVSGLYVCAAIAKVSLGTTMFAILHNWFVHMHTFVN